MQNYLNEISFNHDPINLDRIERPKGDKVSIIKFLELIEDGSITQDELAQIGREWFESKEDYLNWVEEWKGIYKNLSSTICIVKRLRKPSNWKTHDNNRSLQLSKANQARMQHVLSFRPTARMLLALREIAKRMSYAVKMENQELDKLERIA